jgi:hypothetical protein
LAAPMSAPTIAQHNQIKTRISMSAIPSCRRCPQCHLTPDDHALIQGMTPAQVHRLIARLEQQLARLAAHAQSQGHHPPPADPRLN